MKLVIIKKNFFKSVKLISFCFLKAFWPFIKNFMNKFDTERYEMLTHVKNDTGRQRAWIRSCLNEHCLERYIIAILSNQTRLREHYEDWCFLLDKSYNSTLPMLISGLQSILFAINIDNPNLNIPAKIQQPSTAAVSSRKTENNPISSNKLENIHDELKSSISLSVEIESNMARTSAEENSSYTGKKGELSGSLIESKMKKKSSSNSASNSSSTNNSVTRKVRKNNVVLENEIDTTQTQATTTKSCTLQKTPILAQDSPTRSSSSLRSATNLENAFEFNLSTEEGKAELKPDPVKEFIILTNPIKYNPKKEKEKTLAAENGLSEESSENESLSSPEKVEDIYGTSSNPTDTYNSSSRAKFLAGSVNTTPTNVCNLIPIISGSGGARAGGSVNNQIDALSSKVICF